MNVLDATRDMVDDYPGGAASLAPRIGKNATTLCHELNETGTAKLGLKTWLLALRRTGDLRPVQALCTEFGGLFMPVPLLDDANADTMGHVAELLREFSDVTSQLAQRLADGQVDDNDLRVFQREWLQMVAAGGRLMTHLEARNRSEKPAHLTRAA